ncbi:MAG: Gfo/Idh/MocA family oxidoreductase [Ginsengibacter sp.]
MQQINWGIIGCGDVTEMKSGPAFNKVPNSKLIAVMRRDGAKAKDYAERHHVPKWYSNAYDLIHDPEINAVYIATPPSSHLEYAETALKAGKFVYVEKPMTVDFTSAIKLQELVNASGGKLSVAHYRRGQPQFIKIKELIDEDYLGKVKLINLRFFRKNMPADRLTISKYAWRVNPEISGGGLFHDIAPHQLDMLYYIFGKVESANGIACATNNLYAVDDHVSGSILFKNGVLFTGNWCFDIGTNDVEDSCEIIGENGKISFSFFDKQDIVISKKEKTETLHFEKPMHAQQFMIEKVVNYFLDKGKNPCSVEEGVETMLLMKKLTEGE